MNPTNKAYTAAFILDTRNYQEPVENLIEKLTKIFRGLNAKVLKMENLGMKPFSRVLTRKYPEGLYLNFHIEGDSSVPAMLREKLKLDKHVHRLVVFSK